MSTADTGVIVDPPRRRKWSKGEPPLMRIVLLAKSASESSLVGNAILGRSALDSEAPPDVVERVGGRVKDRHVTLISSPHLLQTNISEHQITQTLRECVSLSDPGPHVIVLVLNPPCSAGDGERLELLRDSLSDGLFQHSLVISTREPTHTDEVLQEILQRCSHRHFSLQTSSSPEEILQMCEEIQRSNGGRHLQCVKHQDSQQKETGQVSEGMNVVMCGSDNSLKSSVSELILKDRRSACVRTDVDLHTRLNRLQDLPALVQLSEQEVMRAARRCVSLCHPGVHLFLHIISDIPLTDENKAEMEAIQRIFSSRINRHMMILIKQSSERQTAELSEETQAVLQSFGGRHHFIGPNTHVSTLMEKIEETLEENRGDVYSTETFLETQMEKLMKMQKKIDSLKTHVLSPGSAENEAELRIVLLGKTGVGKSATGNTILGRVAFKAEASFESVTRESQRETSELNGRRVTVIDTPGLFDTELSDEEIRREITHCISMILPGPHVFIIVLNLGQRFTQEEGTAAKILQETFGENSLRFTMVLFTRGDFLKNKTLEQCLGKPGSAIRKLTEACGNRVHVFNNNQTGDPTQVYELLEKIDNMVEENGGSFYSCKMFREMERERQERQMKILMDRVTEREEEMKKHEEEKERMKKMMEEERQNQDEDRKRREEELKREIREEEKHQREIRDEMRRERETFRHEIEEMRKEKEKMRSEKKRREEEFKAEDDEKRRAREKQIQRLQEEMEEIIKEKERIERERQAQIKMREDEQKSFEEKLKLMEDQHEDDLRRRRVEWREEYEREKKEEKRSLQVTETAEERAERKQHLFHRLHLGQHHIQLRAADAFEITQQSLQYIESCAEEVLVQTFIKKLLMMNYRARNIKTYDPNEEYHMQHRHSDSSEFFFDVFTNVSMKRTDQSERIDPMDVQMAVFHCSDGLLKQMMVTKLSQCQFALPLLVPDPFTQQIKFPLWTFRQISKSWKIRNTNNKITSQTQPICKAQTPMVFFFRFGPVSSSKSQLMNSLINEKHNTFFHRNCPGSSRTRVLMNGVVEIAWFCPSGTHEDQFSDCVAFCNLHGDAGDNEKQLQILKEMASVNVVLLPQLNRNDIHAAKIQDLLKNRKPLICVLTEDGSTLIETSKGKFKIGLKDRNQSDVSEELKKAINDCLSESSSTFRLEDVSKHSDIRVDEEDDEDCRRGKAAAQQMMSLLENKKLTEIKESFLPHQGKLWHQWSQKNRELHRSRRKEIEREISRKLTEIEKIRKQQQESNVTKFMQLFIKQINSHSEHQMYFLNWLRILLDEHTSADLSEIQHKYDEKRTTVLKLKEDHNKTEQLAAEQTELERISEDLQSAAFGVEHIMREIAQIYESCESVKENKKDLQVPFSSLPSLAAQMMISGFPLELMDGDAAHVPVVWISAVLDQLVQKLGDQRVFVLSVLGLQSSGKSTMLNAMFGLQFAVSAGRCTRGAFMQLVKVSEEMKRQMNIDYILVVDTEGLRALELAGRSTRHNDNELATFVVGVAHLTLINIFGENPSEMQDVLQIVVQAFLRMKKIRLNPSCVFVHQNVSDVTAGEKNMEGRRRLLEKLDEMTKLSSKDEVCDAEHFSDVIRFDVEKDVKYFAQLWEGSPPMAPPNPKYCENIQDLKKTIIAHASLSDGMRLKDIKYHIKDLWEALLNEQFIFCFRNSLEISAYGKLETEYSKWSWSLRSAMMETENKLHNQIENEIINEVNENHLQTVLKKTSDEVTKSMSEFFEKVTDRDILIKWKVSFEIKIKELQENIVRETKRKLNEILQQRNLKKKIGNQRIHYEDILYEKSRELALELENKPKDNETLKTEFDLFWEQSVKKIISDTPQIKDLNIMSDIKMILSDIYKSAPLDHIMKSRDIFTVQSYSDYITVKKSSVIRRNVKDAYRSAKEKWGYFLSENDQTQLRSFVTDVSLQTNKKIQSFNISEMGYSISCIQQITGYIKARLTEHEEGPVKYVFKNEFFMDLVISFFKREERTITDQHRLFRKANDPVIYVEKKREEYYSIFQKYCHGATSAAVFGQIICQKLKEPIEQSVYKKTSRDLADGMIRNFEPLNGNRSNLEKHLLKTLAEEEDFDKYMDYIHNPRDHFKSFIRDEVSHYIRDTFNASVSPKMKENIELLQKKILRAAHESTEHVQLNSGDVHLWLKSFTQKLSDELIFSERDLSGVKHGDVDFNLLEDVIKKELDAVTSEINGRFSRETFPVKLDCKFRPDELLVDHFCQCCWVQCPFCRAICTNTIENHDGDHSVPFHRVNGLSGFYYDGTQYLCTEFCSSLVMKSKSFKSSGQWFPYKQYRSAGGVYADWSITPDLSELPYWKWVVCRFQTDLEKYYSKTFSHCGKIPDEWRKYSKLDAVESLEYI